MDQLGTDLRLKRFICIDVDRTILRTTVFFDQLVLPTLQSLAAQQASGPDDLARREQVIVSLVRDLRENTGKSFDFLAAYNERVDAVDQVTAEYMAKQLIERIFHQGQLRLELANLLLADGALELMQAAEQLPDTAWGLLTSGGVQTQTLKLIVLAAIIAEELGLSAKAQIITTEHKTRDVDTIWRQTNGLFLVPEALSGGVNMLVEQVIMIDDKPKNLIADNLDGITTILVEQLDLPDDGQPRLFLRQVIQIIQAT